MKSPTKFFLACLALALLIVGGEYLYSQHLKNQVDRAVRACEAQSLREVGAARAARNKELGRFVFVGLVCDKFDPLFGGVNAHAQLTGVQKELGAAIDAERSFRHGVGADIAAGLILLGILPTAWYFLLRRLREVAAAVRGE